MKMNRELIESYPYLLGVEQSSIGPKPDFIDDGGLEVDKHGPGHVLAPGGFGEEGVEGVVSNPVAVVLRHGAVRVDPVLQAVQLPDNTMQQMLYVWKIF